MKEKKLLRWMMIRTIVIVGAFLAFVVISGLVTDKSFTYKSINMSNRLARHTEGAVFEPEKVTARIDRPELVTLTEVRRAGDEVFVTFEPLMNGAGETYAELVDPETGEIVDNAALKVTANGWMIETMTGNFTHYRERQIGTILLTWALAALLWVGFARSVREIRFSYQSIFCVGFGLWMTLGAVLITTQYFKNESMINLYALLESASKQLIFYTFPLVFIFAVLLTISNISLIRHEGFRVQNALGIMISLVMVGGFVFLFFFSGLVSSGSKLEVDLWEMFISILETVYALLECFLIGSVICGTLAAKRRPAFDKDYIVILGCRIRKDGTLYPLIRGRVDRAIRFYQDQLEATGRKAILIPSGGQGRDEIMPEAEAMQRYLLEKGIEPEQIMPETKSVNTRQNMQFSMQMMEKGRKAVFSTTNYHVFRSGIIAGQVGLEIDGIGSRTKWYFWPNAYVREVIGMISYKWKTLVIALIPIVAFYAMVRFLF